ncbi:hypothetical protein Pan216_44230 [Planctomycetes bacterium Pan216]|uniref:Uncharacterized protein n=1 Tax=Kolteria novifilia TaxID=2527975 RepID=A0A518B9E8_9BACT|nr:hypothetical protein Pan216_44230 [Planctomycetes bacterium Pan216]
MSDDFFEHLTDPNRDALPSDRREWELATEWEPALELLREAGPTNGINLVPAWDRLLAEDPAASTPPKRRWNPPRWLTRVAVAASLLIGGIAIGQSMGHGVSPTQGDRWLPATGGKEVACSYTPRQREQMFALLAQSAKRTPALAEAASANLSQCVACHQSALGDLIQPSFSALPR